MYSFSSKSALFFHSVVYFHRRFRINRSLSKRFCSVSVTFQFAAHSAAYPTLSQEIFLNQQGRSRKLAAMIRCQRNRRHFVFVERRSWRQRCAASCTIQPAAQQVCTWFSVFQRNNLRCIFLRNNEEVLLQKRTNHDFSGRSAR